MPAYADRTDFLPPPAPGVLRALVLALIAHLLLLLALSWGVHWNHQSQEISVDAELWSALPQEAAPKPVEVAPEPEPTPQVIVPPPPPPPEVKAPDIVERKVPPPKALVKPPPEVKPKPEPPQKPKVDEKKQAEAKAKADQAAQDKALIAQRDNALKRMLNDANSGPTGTGGAGTAAHSSGPSASYAGRIRARVKPNIVFGDVIDGNPSAEVEVRTAPDGTIVGRRLTKSSGVKTWDEAVLRAIDKTEVLPRDIDGTMPASMILAFRPKD